MGQFKDAHRQLMLRLHPDQVRDTRAERFFGDAGQKVASVAFGNMSRAVHSAAAPPAFVPASGEANAQRPATSAEVPRDYAGARTSTEPPGARTGTKPSGKPTAFHVDDTGKHMDEIEPGTRMWRRHVKCTYCDNVTVSPWGTWGSDGFAQAHLRAQGWGFRGFRDLGVLGVRGLGV